MVAVGGELPAVAAAGGAGAVAGAVGFDEMVIGDVVAVGVTRLAVVGAGWVVGAPAGVPGAEGEAAGQGYSATKRTEVKNQGKDGGRQPLSEMAGEKGQP